MSQRDLSIIETLARVRVASVRQLERLHFRGQARTARRVLQDLTKRRVVARLGRTVGGVRAGSAGHVYGLDVVGQHLAKRGGPAGGSRFRRPWTPGQMFVQHALAVTELYVRLVEAEQAGRCGLLEFAAEPECWRNFSGLGGGHLVLKPDALVRLGFSAYEDSYFIEVDRGTESVPAIIRKAGVYRQYWASGLEQARTGVFPRVLWIVQDQAREKKVRLALSSRVAGEPDVHSVVVFADLDTALFSEELETV